ncbi:hypothetical protein LguiB_032596 [Lonicera macranthoides]
MQREIIVRNTSTNSEKERSSTKNIKETIKMGMLPCKRLILAAFILLCFFTTTTNARSLLRESNVAEKVHSEEFMAKEESADHESEELVVEDYTPARKKSPIHN